MILLDATALIALILDEPAAPEVQRILLRGSVGITSINLAETVDVLVRVFGHELEAVEAVLVPLLVGDIEVITVDERIGRESARLRIAHYHVTKRPLSMADCVLLGAAVTRGDSIATSDRPVAVVCRSEGIEIIALPDSNGSRP